MTQPPREPERVPDATAQNLLARAAELDADGPSLTQLRQAAIEAGISASAFDAAVAEWRAAGLRVAAPTSAARPPGSWVGRNALALATGWVAAFGLAAAERLAGAPWLVHKLSDPLGLAIGAAVALRLRARTANVVLVGLALSQTTEFLMDWFSGAPAVQGFGAHMALMTAGVAGSAIVNHLWRRSRGGPMIGEGITDVSATAVPDTSEASKPVGLTSVEAVGRSAERSLRSLYGIRPLLN